ncbi:ABC transporter permease [Desulfococcaceae bacterium HSG8]|nr:ABC transporter permease [Desulfococcaceae bacterium HSG8]
MKLHNIAINNLRRRKTKALFLLMGLMIGVTSVVALLTATRVMKEDIVHKMEEFGANIIITPRSEGISLNYGGLSLGGISFDLREIAETDLAKIRTIKNADNIRTVSPKIFGAFENRDRKALVVGVNFASELSLKPWWKLSGAAPKTDEEILAGQEAAERFGLKPGSPITIKDKEFRISGILNLTGSQDDSLFFMKLPMAQEIFNKTGKVAMAEVAAHCGNCPITEIVRQISERIPAAKVTAVQQVVEGRMGTLAGLQKLSLGISAIVLLVGAMVVFVTMMASVNERTREIGIFSAIGFRRSHIMRIILLEALIVSFTAGVIGYLAGIGGTHFFLPFFIGKIAGFTPDPIVAAGSLLLSVLIGLAASFYPAMTASKMDPSEALRTL